MASLSLQNLKDLFMKYGSNIPQQIPDMTVQGYGGTPPSYDGYQSGMAAPDNANYSDYGDTRYSNNPNAPSWNIDGTEYENNPYLNGQAPAPSPIPHTEQDDNRRYEVVIPRSYQTYR